MGKAILSVCKKAQSEMANRSNFWLLRKPSGFVIYSHFNLHQLRLCKVLTQICERGTICHYKITKIVRAL